MQEQNAQKSYSKQLVDLGCCPNSPAWPDVFASRISKFCKSKRETPIRTLSLFSGAGGLDIGFTDAGFEIVESVELEERFCQTLRANTGKNGYLGNTKVNCIDIRDYEPECEGIEFIIGGPPCQTFSAAGRRANGVLGTNDPRGVLFKEYARVLKKLKPKGFLFENVYGIVGAENGKPWSAICKTFNDLGYTLYHRILDAADYGVPQHRERLIIVGIKDGEYLFPRPVFGVDSFDNAPFYSAKNAITNANVDGTEIPSHINGRYGHLIDEIPPGLNYSFFTDHMGYPKPIFAWRSKFSDFMYKADPLMPVRTIKAQGGQYTGPFHWEGRHFSLPEYKRLQTFPDSYEIEGGRGTIIHQLGNSVPPQLARILALSIRDQIFNRDIPVMLEYLSENQTLSFRKEKAKLTKMYKEKAAQAISSMMPSDYEQPSSEDCYLDIDDCFKITRSNDDHAQYHLKADFDDKTARFTLKDHGDIDTFKNYYELQISPINNWGMPYASIFANAYGNSALSLTVLWKTIEESIARMGGAADLVQLNGYYQYKPELQIDLYSKTSTPLDSVLFNITSGICTRRNMSTTELASIWHIQPRDVKKYAKKLKLLGFEIRNSNTNPQIPKDQWLIPYEFPTLNPMSIQLRKKV